LQLSATNTTNRVQGTVENLITICYKFAVVIREIWQTGQQNLEKFAMENRGPYL